MNSQLTNDNTPLNSQEAPWIQKSLTGPEANAVKASIGKVLQANSVNHQ